jgi:hypothetical protein
VLIGMALAAGPLGGASHTARVGMVLMAATVPLLVYRGCLYGAARGAGWLRPLGVMQVLGLGVYTAGVVVAFVTGILGLGLALALSLVPYAADAFVGWRAARPGWRRPQPMRTLVGFGARAVLGQLAEVSNLRLDQALMVPLAGATRARE